MKILITVEYYAVSHGGGIAEQARQIAEGLHRLGHEVIVATGAAHNRAREIRGISVIGFAVSGNALDGFSGERTRYEEFLTGSRFDAIIQFAVNSWTTDIAMNIAEKIPSLKILSTPGLSKLGNPRYDAYYNGPYLAGLAHYDRIVYTSANYQDKLFGDAHGLGKKAAIIPNGASAEEFLATDRYQFRERHRVTTRYMALCVSNHFVGKGHQFVIETFKKMKRDDTTLVIIGEARFRLDRRSIGHLVLDYARCKAASAANRHIKLVRGAPREAVISAYKEADVFLFGSKLECSPLVMYESFAAKLPFVTRPVGNAADHAEVIKIAENPLAMASAANYLLDDAPAAKTMTEAAYKLWEKNYTWDIIARQYEKMLQSIA